MSEKPARSVRKDVLRNREALVAAARAELSEHGLALSLEQVARRAGVGIATLYRHFPKRAELVDAVLVEAVEQHAELSEAALREPDPWTAFATFLERTAELESTNRGLNDLLSVQLDGMPACRAVKLRHYYNIRTIITRAQEDGSLRADLRAEDLVFITWGNAGILEASALADEPGIWRRHLSFLLDGLRARAATPAPLPPMSPAEMQRVMERLGEKRTGQA
ncbi:TetR/AcrR family transcriptional regulator [Streptomyces sp. NPDC091294]|uniref:TetR/AcrR family transcriptional regulator n=1 Tax=Streptomyces sp. NPDC091294 TaxID=3365992 RepID=UPI0037FD169B